MKIKNYKTDINDKSIFCLLVIYISLGNLGCLSCVSSSLSNTFLFNLLAVLVKLSIHLGLVFCLVYVDTVIIMKSL